LDYKNPVQIVIIWTTLFCNSATVVLHEEIFTSVFPELGPSNE